MLCALTFTVVFSMKDLVRVTGYFWFVKILLSLCDMIFTSYSILQVEGMVKKLDILLQGIEGKGGFTDASINSQKELVRELEDTMWALSSRCRMWRVSSIFM